MYLISKGLDIHEVHCVILANKTLRETDKKQRDAICSATVDWAQWSSAWRECWSTGRGKEGGIDGWMEERAGADKWSGNEREWLLCYSWPQQLSASLTMTTGSPLPSPSVEQGPIFNSLGCKTSKQPAGASEKALTPYFNFIIFDENVTNKPNRELESGHGSLSSLNINIWDFNVGACYVGKLFTEQRKYIVRQYLMIRTQTWLK